MSIEHGIGNTTGGSLCHPWSQQTGQGVEVVVTHTEQERQRDMHTHTHKHREGGGGRERRVFTHNCLTPSGSHELQEAVLWLSVSFVCVVCAPSSWLHDIAWLLTSHLFIFYVILVALRQIN